MNVAVAVAAADGGGEGVAAAAVAAVETAMATDLSLDSTTYADEMYDSILDYDLFERFNENKTNDGCISTNIDDLIILNYNDISKDFFPQFS